MRKANYELMASLARSAGRAGRLSNVSAAKSIPTAKKIWRAPLPRFRKIRTSIPELLEALPQEDTKETAR